MPHLASLRSALPLAAGMALSLPMLTPLPVKAQLLPPGADTQVIENLAELPTIPIEDFPDVILTPEMIRQFAAVGTPLPPEVQPGRAVAAEDLFRIGNFEPFGLPDASMETLARATGQSTQRLTMADVEPVLELVTLNKLLEETRLRGLDQRLVAEVPAIKAVLVQTVFERMRLRDTASLGQLDSLLARRNGNLGNLVSQLKSTIAPGDEVDVARLPIDLDIGQGLGDGVFAPELLDRQLDQILGRLTVEELARSFPAMGDMPLSNLSPSLLKDISLRDAVPNLTRLPIGQISGIETLPLSSFGALNVQSLSLGQMPDPMRLVGGVRFGIADVALGEPGVGSHEQRRMRVVSGGITSKRKQLTGRRCTGNECPHFEISDPSNLAYHGAAWMDGNTQVPDGFGLLCRPFRCKGPAGNHPFGSGVRVQLRNIDQAAGTAQVSLTFGYCKRILFVGKTCTPWIFPVPSGIPIGIIREQTVLPYAPPSQVK